MRWGEPAILSLVSETAVTKFTPGLGRRPKKRNGSVILGGLILAALWFNLCKQLSGEWLVNEQYNYGWFVPFISLYLFWLRWQDQPAPSPPSKTSCPWIFICVPALFLLLPIRLFEIGTPEWRPLGWIHTASVAGLTLLCIWSVGGKPWLRHFAFPVAFFFVAVPWVTPIEVPIIQGLMRVVAAVAAENISEVNRWHTVAGYAIVGLVFVGTVILATLLGRGKAEVKDQRAADTFQRSSTPQSSSSFILPTSYFVFAFFWIVAVELGA